MLYFALQSLIRISKVMKFDHSITVFKFQGSCPNPMLNFFGLQNSFLFCHLLCNSDVTVSNTFSITGLFLGAPKGKLL